MTTPLDRSADDAGQGVPPGEGADHGQLGACELFGSVAAELALGSLMGADRSGALAHLEICDDCSALIADLSATADTLLLVAPEADPPAGFEMRWLARIRPEGDAGRLAAPPQALGPAPAPAPATAAASPRGAVVPFRRRARVVLAAAAAAVVIAGAGIGLGVAVAPQRGNQATVGSIRLAALRSASSYLAPAAVVGEVAIITGSPSWVLMTFQQPGWSGAVECVVIEHGQARKIGTFLMHDGWGAWALRLGPSGASVTSAEVRATTGSVLAAASFAG